MERVQEKLVLYFAETDGWVANDVRDDLIRAYPRARHVRCSEGHVHAFVLDPASSRRMAEHTWSWVKEDMAAVDAAAGGAAALAQTSVVGRRGSARTRSRSRSRSGSGGKL
jgi:hypothetical protein